MIAVHMVIGQVQSAEVGVPIEAKPCKRSTLEAKDRNGMTTWAASGAEGGVIVNSLVTAYRRLCRRNDRDDPK